MRAFLLALVAGVLVAGLIAFGVNAWVDAKRLGQPLGGELFMLVAALAGLVGGLGAAMTVWLLVRTWGRETAAR